MRILLYILIAASPFFLASNRLPFQWLWVAWASIIGIVLAARLSKQKNFFSTDNPILLPTMIGVLFVVWGLVQAMVPVGSTMVYDIPAVDDVLKAQAVISAVPSDTIANSAFFWAHLLIFVAAYAICDRRYNAVFFVRFSAIIGAVYALYGFIAFAAGNEYVLWFEKIVSHNSLTSTFINRNSYAAYAGMGLQCLVAYTFFWIQKEIAEGRSGRERARQVLEALLTRAWWLPLAIFLTATALVLTNSRAGFASAAIGIFTLLMLSPNNFGTGKGSSLKRGGFALLVMVAVSVVFSISGEVLEARYQNAELDILRSQAYDAILLAISDYPITGTGLGTFEDVFFFYQPFEFTGFFDRAHSDHLEIIMTAGIPAAAALYIAFLYTVLKLVRALKFGLEYRSFIALGLGVIVQLGLHSAVDFSLQMPANSYLFVVILGVSLAVARRSEQAYRPVKPTDS